MENPVDSPGASPDADPPPPEALLSHPEDIEAGTPRRKQSSGKDAIFEVSVIVLGALLLALLLKVYVAEAYQIRGRSMEPTFLDGQRVMLQKVLYTIQRGDIVIFTSKSDPHKDLIKRVIGLPGDVVRVEDGEVTINGKKLQENYILKDSDHFRQKVCSMKVEDGTFFVLGDNRPESQDSRDFRLVDSSTVKGKVVLLWWPFQDLRAF